MGFHRTMHHASGGSARETKPVSLSDAHLILFETILRFMPPLWA